MAQVKYSKSRPIEPRQHTVWIVEFPNGERRITVWSKDATIENVHGFYKARFNKFRVGLLGVGEHIITKTNHSYMDDGRFVDQDWNVLLS